MEKTNKVMRIVLSVVTFVAIALVVVGVLALPLQANIADGKVVASANIYDFIKNFIDLAKALPAMGEGALQQIAPLMMILIVIVFTVIFGIIAIVKGIILLIKTIKGMSGKGELNPLLKSLIGFGVIVVIYIGLLLGVIYSGAEHQSVTLGAGSEMMLSGGLMALVIPGVYRVATKDDRKLVNKILGFASATCAIVALVLGLAATMTLPGDTTSGIFTTVFLFIQNMTSGVAPEGKVVFGLVLAIMGMVIVLVSLGFAKSVISNGYLIDEEKKVDYEKSSIVKSALMFGFMVVGFLLIVIPLSSNNIGMGAGAIVAMIFGALALGAAIANKIISGKAAAPKAEESKAE